MSKLEIKKIIDSVKNEVDRNYDLTCENIIDIISISNINADLIANGFYLGYAQGVKNQGKTTSANKKRG